MQSALDRSPSAARRLARALLTIACGLVAALSFGGDARAQTTTTTSTTGNQTVTLTGTVTRLPGATGSLPNHPSGVAVNIINYSDCINDEVLNIPLSLAGTLGQGYELQAWATESGNNCTDPNARNGTTTLCWLVQDGINGTVATSEANIRVQDILSQYGKAEKNPRPAKAGAEACTGITPGPHAISIFIFFVTGTSASGTGATYNVTAAMQAPALSGDIALGAGDSLLKVSLPDTSDTTIAGYTIYCDPPSGAAAPTGVPEASVIPPTCTASVDAGVADAGTGDATLADATVVADATVPDAADATIGDASTNAEAGLDGAVDLDAAAADAAVQTDCGIPVYSSPTSSANTCTSAVLIPQGTSTGFSSDASSTSDAGTETTTDTTTIRPPPPTTYECGSVSGTSSSVIVSGLSNGVAYTVAAASNDIYGNTGPLSQLACGTPKETTDFWNIYRQDGGDAGGGFCSVRAVGAGGAGGAGGSLGLTLAASGLVLARRRRRRS